MNVALKEWDAQVRALETAQTALLFRKGGIIEKRGEFSVEHERFWFYPTFLHQNTGELKPQHHALLRPNPHIGRVRLQSFAVVEGAYKLEDMQAVARLEPHNPLSLAALEQKFLYRNKPYVYALLLRIYIATATDILETPDYAGCVSWVALEQEILPQQAKPVLSDTAFSSLKALIEGLL